MSSKFMTWEEVLIKYTNTFKFIIWKDVPAKYTEEMVSSSPR